MTADPRSPARTVKIAAGVIVLTLGITISQYLYAKKATLRDCQEHGGLRVVSRVAEPAIFAEISDDPVDDHRALTPGCGTNCAGQLSLLSQRLAPEVRRCEPGSLCRWILNQAKHGHVLPDGQGAATVLTANPHLLPGCVQTQKLGAQVRPGALAPAPVYRCAVTSIRNSTPLLIYSHSAPESAGIGALGPQVHRSGWQLIDLRRGRNTITFAEYGINGTVLDYVLNRTIFNGFRAAISSTFSSSNVCTAQDLRGLDGAVFSPHFYSPEADYALGTNLIIRKG